MPSTYPTDLQSFYDPQSNDKMDGSGPGGAPSVHSLQHSELNDAMLAVQTYLGTTGDLGAIGATIATSGSVVSQSGFTYVTGPIGSNDVTGATDTPAIAALAGAGKIISLRPNTNYYVTSLPQVTLNQNLVALGPNTFIFDVSTGGGTLLKIAGTQWGSSASTWSPYNPAPGGGFTIDGSLHTGTAAVAIEAGSIVALSQSDIKVQNYTAANDIAYWMNNVAVNGFEAWAERNEWLRCTSTNNTNHIVWDNNGGANSHDYNTYEFRLDVSPNQNALVFKNGVQLIGVRFNFIGNFGAQPTSNTAVAWTIGADSSAVQITPAFVYQSFEIDGTSGYVGPTTFNMGGSAFFNGSQGVMNFRGASGIAWQAGNISPQTNKFTFAGYIVGDTNFPQNQTGEGLNVFGGSSWCKGATFSSGSGPATFTVDVNTGDHFTATLVAGVNDLVLAFGSTHNSKTIHLYLTQPTGLASVNVASPGNNAQGTTQTIANWPNLSQVVGAIDHVMLTTHNGIAWFATLLGNAGQPKSPVASVTSFGPEVSFRPAGWTSESYPRQLQLTSSGGQAMVSGTLQMQAVYLEAGTVVGHIDFNNLITTAVTPTNWWAGLYDNALNQLAVTADQTTGAIAANTPFSLAIATTAAGSATSFICPYSGLYYIGIMIVAGTMPTLESRATSANSLAKSQAPILAGTSDTAQTAPPAFPHAATALTANGTIYCGTA